MNSPSITGKAEQVIDFLMKLAHHVELIEHVSGRIKMRVPFTQLPSVIALFGGVDVENGARSIPGLKRYEVNPWGRSATICYDPGVLSVGLWDDFCSIRRDPSAAKSFRERLLSIFETQLVQNPE